MQKVTLSAYTRKLPRELFYECRNLTSVTFPDKCSTISIGHSAFQNCISLESINFPDSLLTINDRAFYRCKNLKQVHFPTGLKHIGDYAFYFCALDTLELPDTLETIGESAFFKCKNLIGIELPPSVKSIGKWVFHGCDRLKYLTIRHNPEFIGEWIINRAATIRCYKGSVADRYCQENEFKVEYLEGKMPTYIWK